MKQLLLLIMLLLISACASTKDITKLPNQSPFPIIRKTNIIGMDGIFVRTSIIKLKNVKENDESYTIPVYLSNQSIIKIDESIAMIYIVVQVFNKKKLNYSLWEVYEIKRLEDKYPYKIEHMKYKYRYNGKSTNQIKFVLPINKPIINGTYSIELRDQDGNTRMILGTIKYKR